MSLAKIFDHENLVAISRLQMSALETRIESNYFLDMTRNSTRVGDQAGTIRRAVEGRILTVTHYEPKPIAGTGLNLVYKADKELWMAFETLEAKLR
jgi:hypothetical protein